MRVRHTSAFALHLLLVLTSLLAATGHDHLGAPAPEPRLCVVDHDGGHDQDAPLAAPHVESAAHQHEHKCLGCRLGSQRLSLDVPRQSGQPLVSFAAAWQGSDSPAQPQRLPSGRSSRGPPIR